MSLEAPEETQFCQHLDFSSVIHLLQTYSLQDCQIINLCVLKHRVCGDLLQQQEESSAVQCTSKLESETP